MRMTDARLLALYPRAWRKRYGAELAAFLADDPPTFRDRLDLLRGAVDAHLHPLTPSRVPPLAALTGGGLWLLAGLVVAAEPTPPDWPGYTLDVLPIALVGTVVLLVAVVGTWLRLGDAGGAFGRLAVDVAIAGHLAWIAALGAAIVGVDYGATTALAATAAAGGTALVGLALARAGDWPMAGLVAAAAASAVLPTPGGWLAFGLTWSGVGLVAWRDRETVARRTVSPGRR